MWAKPSCAQRDLMRVWSTCAELRCFSGEGTIGLGGDRRGIVDEIVVDDDLAGALLGPDPETAAGSTRAMGSWRSMRQSRGSS